MHALRFQNAMPRHIAYTNKQLYLPAIKSNLTTMKSLFTLLLFTIFGTSIAFSQSTIVKKDGKKHLATITKEDDQNIYFTTRINNRKVYSFIAKEQIDTVYYSNPTTAFLYPEKSVLGIGIGQDYGGFGLNLTIYPHQNIGLFAGGGHAIADMSYNVGLRLRGNVKNEGASVVPYFTYMYGYNAAIAVTDAKKYNKLFFGSTIGFGIETKPKAMRKGYWSFAILIPLRSSDVQDYIDDLEDKHGVEFKSDLFPVSFSIGYKVMIQ